MKTRDLTPNDCIIYINGSRQRSLTGTKDTIELRGLKRGGGGTGVSGGGGGGGENG